MSKKKILYWAAMFCSTALVFYNCGNATDSSSEGSEIEEVEGKGDTNSNIQLASALSEYQEGASVGVGISTTYKKRTTPIFVSECMPITVLQKVGKEWRPFGPVAKCSSKDGIVKIVSEEACNQYFLPNDETPSVICSDEGMAKAPDCCDEQGVFGYGKEFANLPIGTYKAVANYKFGCNGIANYSECKATARAVTSKEFVVKEKTDANPNSCSVLDDGIADCVYDGDTVESCVGEPGTEKYKLAQDCCEQEGFNFCSVFAGQYYVELSAFDKLSKANKMKALFSNYLADPDYGQYQEILIAKRFGYLVQNENEFTATGKAVYNAVSQEATKNGGGAPSVLAIVRGGIVFAYSFETSGRSYGSWGRTQVFDRFLKPIGEFGWSD